MTKIKRTAFSILSLLLLLLTSQMQAQTVVSLTSGTGHPGDEVEVNVALTGVASVTALQLHIPLGSALTYVEGSAKLSTDLATNNHELSVSQSDETLKILVHSIPLKTFKAASGALLSFKLQLGSEPGTYDLIPTPVLSDVQGKTVKCNVSKGQMTVLSPKIQLSTNTIHFGRVPIRGTYTENIVVTNIGNEPLEVKTANCSLAHISVGTLPFTLAAGAKQPLTVTYAPTQYGKEEGTITLTSNAANGNQRIDFDAEPYSVNILSVSDANGKSDEEVTIHVNLQNMEQIVAAQGSIKLPEGVTYVEESAQLNASRANGHQLSATSTNGLLSFYVHSANNTALKGVEGELLTFRLKIGSTGGSYQLTLSDVILSNIEGKDMTSSTEGATLRIAAPQIACANELDFGKVSIEEGVATRAFTIRNTGEKALSISRVEFSSPEFSLTTTLEALNAQLSTQNSADLMISYKPNGEQQLETMIQIYSNDPDNRMIVVALKAQSYHPNSLSLSGKHTNEPAGGYEVTVNLQNTLPIVALQFDIHWIAEMTTTQDQLALSLRASDHQITLYHVDATTYRVFIYSNTNAAIAAGEGPLLSIIYNKESEVQIEQTIIQIDNVILSTLEEKNRASTMTASMVVKAQEPDEPEGLLGDANGDGIVTVTDVVCVVEYIQGRQPAGFNKKLADVTQDGDITVSDIAGIINIIMKKEE